MAGFKFGCASGSGYVTCDMDCELEIASPILLGTNDYSGAGGGTGPVYAKRSAILNYSVTNVDVLMGAFIVDTSQQVPTFYDIYNWTSGYNKLLGKDGIQTGNYHGYFGYVSSGNLKNAYNDANIPIFTDPDEFFAYLNPVATYTSNGGGATHIAKVTGQLKDLSSNLSDILMVSGGGGGGLLVGDTDYSGKEAGGISGSGDNSADQSTGNAFGQGESGTNVSGGGSGLYGGYKGTSAKSGGAGSGYIDNSLLSNKKMVGYNVPTSDAEGTKTESVNVASNIPTANVPKIGNGFARIKYLRDPQLANMEEHIPDGAFGWSVSYDSANNENHVTGQCNQYWEYYECPVTVKKNTNYTLSLKFKGSGMNYFAAYDCPCICKRFASASEIQAADGLWSSGLGDLVMAQCETHFVNSGSYIDMTVSFNSGDQEEIWVYLGLGYVYTGTWIDVYFKDIKLTQN